MSDFHDIRGLRAFLSLNDFELDSVSLSKGLEALRLDRAEVHENIRSTFARNEAKTFRVVEPLYGASDTCHTDVPLPPLGLTVLRPAACSRSMAASRRV